MAEVLGRVVQSDLATPRGPDAIHRIRVPRAWLERGATVEFELPRHLTCAACEGGGCDTCQRSGAVTVRGRDEPCELISVSLPQGARDGAFVIRMPERGGFPVLDRALPRGHLFLRVEASAGDASTSVAIRDRNALAGTATWYPLLAKVLSGRALLLLLLALSILVAIWLVWRR